jgi:hypothetical protein
MIPNPYFKREKDRRYKILYVSPELLMNALFAGGLSNTSITVEGMPTDCQIVGVHYSEDRISFAFMLYHESFDIVPEVNCIPTISPTFTAHDKPKAGREFI